MAKVMAELASSAKWPDRVNVGVSTLALSVTYPVGDDTDKDGLPLERILWVFVGLGVARDAIALALPEDTEEAIGAAQLAMTVCNEALIVWIMIVELQGSYDGGTSFFKFVQNTVQALSDGLAARARTIPTDDPDPDTRAALIAAKAAYTGYSSAVGLISALLNLVRTLMSDSNDIHYVF